MKCGEIYRAPLLSKRYAVRIEGGRTSGRKGLNLTPQVVAVTWLSGPLEGRKAVIAAEGLVR